MKIRVNYNLQIEVDRNKDDCRREVAHCHVTRNGHRVAQVRLNPVSIAYGHSLSRSEINEVIRVVEANHDELLLEYDITRLFGPC